MPNTHTFVTMSLPRVVSQRLGRITVHEAFAGDGAHAALRGGLEEGVHRMRMHGAETGDRGGAIAQTFIEEQLRHAPGMRHIRELLLGDGSGTRRVIVEMVTANYFEALGVGAAPRGRLLTATDDSPGDAVAAVRLRPGSAR